ncbi:MAG TPA: hypothetical protein V6C88_07345 [Chroococcidiopsis sp.]
MVAFQEILGKTQAESFATSLQVLVNHLEIHQRQLISALQETTTTLEVFKRLGSGDSTKTVEPLTLAAIAQLEQTVVPQLHAIAEHAVREEVRPASIEADDDIAQATPAAEAVTTKPATKRKVTKASKKTLSKSGGAQKYSTFHPRHSTVREFQGKTLREAIKIVLKRRENEALGIDEVMDALYGKTISKESYKVAKSVVVVELSKGKLAKLWSSVPGRRGHYIFTTDSGFDLEEA